MKVSEPEHLRWSVGDPHFPKDYICDVSGTKNTAFLLDRLRQMVNVPVETRISGEWSLLAINKAPKLAVFILRH